jgi:ammonium transporter, Amt family
VFAQIESAKWRNYYFREMEELREKLLAIHERIEELKEARFLAENSTLTESQFGTGDTAWILISTVLVLGMTLPGIMLYYAGMVRLGNALSTAMQGFGLAALITLLWLCFGYSLAFGPASGDDINAVIFGDASRFWLHGVYTTGSTHVLAPTIPESVFCSFQLAFAIITPCLICGAFADRMKYNAVLLSLGLWHLVVYCPIAHSNWHPNGFLNEAGVLDFAGGNVVHISAGVSALVSALIVGNRTGFGKTVFQAHNLMLSLVGKT